MSKPIGGFNVEEVGVMAGSAFLHVNGVEFELADGVTSADEAKQLYDSRVHDMVGAAPLASQQVFTIRVEKGPTTQLTVDPSQVWAAAVYFREKPEGGMLWGG